MKSNFDLNELTSYYRSELSDRKIQSAYSYLIKYVKKLKVDIEKTRPDYSFGNVSQGYMDYTYFPITNKYLKSNLLRFGIVFNHVDVRFELWLMGQNASIQKDYLYKLKTSQWNDSNRELTTYSVLEIILVDNPDFSNIDQLTNTIQKKAFKYIEEICIYIKKIDK